jgi:hypothetical protein
MEEKTYYKKILVNSGEVPEKTGWYLTNLGYAKWGNLREYGKIWHWQDGINNDHLNPISNYKITWWLKEFSVPSPKQEIEQLIEDYKRRIKTIGNMKGKDTTEIARLVTKASCYKTFITELERVIR